MTWNTLLKVFVSILLVPVWLFCTLLCFGTADSETSVFVILTVIGGFLGIPLLLKYVWSKGPKLKGWSNENKKVQTS